MNARTKPNLRYQRAGDFASLSRGLASLNKPGGASLADIGEQQGTVPALLEGLTRAVDGMLDQEYEEQKFALERQAEQEKQQAKIDQQNAKLDGATAGSLAALEGRKVQLRQELTAAGRTFNNSLVTAYLSDLDVTVDRQAREILAETKNDPQAFSERFEALESGVIEQWKGSRYEGAVTAGMARLRAQHMAKIRDTHLNNLKADANAKLITSSDHYRGRALEAWRNADAGQAASWGALWVQSLESRTDLSPQQKAAAQLDLEREAKRHALTGEVERMLSEPGGIDATKGFLETFRTSGDIESYPGQKDVFDPAERDDLAAIVEAQITDAETKQQRAQAEAKAQAEHQRAWQLHDLGEAAGRGELTRQQLAELRPTVTPAEHGRIEKRIDDFEADERRKTEAIGQVARILNHAEEPPESVQGRQTLTDAYYAGRIVPGLEGQPFRQQLTTIARLSGRMGRIPSPVRASVLENLRGGDPAAKVRAANTAAALGLENPELVSVLFEGAAAERRMADLILRYGSHGVEPSQAVAKAEADVLQATEAVKADRYRQAGATVAQAWQQATTNLPELGHQPGPNVAAFRAEFEAVYADELAATGNPAQAYAFSLKTMKRMAESADGPEFTFTRQPASMLNDALRAAGYKTAPKPGSKEARRVLKLRAAFQDRVTAWTLETGKKPAPAEVQSIVDQLFMGVSIDDGWLSGTELPSGALLPEDREGTFGDRRVYVPLTEIPKETQAQAGQALEAYGLEVTSENIEELVAVQRTDGQEGVSAWFKSKGVDLSKRAQMSDDDLLTNRDGRGSYVPR